MKDANMFDWEAVRAAGERGPVLSDYKGKNSTLNLIIACLKEYARQTAQAERLEQQSRTPSATPAAWRMCSRCRQHEGQIVESDGSALCVRCKVDKSGWLIAVPDREAPMADPNALDAPSDVPPPASVQEHARLWAKRIGIRRPFCAPVLCDRHHDDVMTGLALPLDDAGRCWLCQTLEARARYDVLRDEALRVVSACADALDKFLGDTDMGDPDDDPPLAACRGANRFLIKHLGRSR